MLQTCWYLADHACWDAPASVQNQFPEGCDRAKTCQDKSAGMNSRRYLRSLYSNVLHTFPYHLHGSAKGIRDKCCLCLSRCKNRNAACVVFKHENQQEINYFMLKETPTHHSRIVHAQHKTSACFHYSKELPTASQGVGLAPLLSLCLNAVKRGQLTCDFRCTGLANRRSRSLQALKSSGIHEIYSI